jgi:tRNA(Ile)-lysidine synthase
LIGPDARLGVAVSGGPDSLALLLLAAVARRGKVEAATVDHKLRAESSTEGGFVASVCARLSVKHASLQIDWPEKPSSNVQAIARDARYFVLAEWARLNGLSAIATAHHADDQGETVLMRLARGAGVGGLGGIRPVRRLTDKVMLVRPLLTWRRIELQSIVDKAELTAVDDPSNSSSRFDRTAARALLASTDWLDPARLAAAASHCRDADFALGWVAAREFETRAERSGSTLLLDVHGLPRELKRRLLLLAMAKLGAAEPAGPEIVSAMERLEAGEVTTLAGLKLEGGMTWRLSLAPPRIRRSGIRGLSVLGTRN